MSLHSWSTGVWQQLGEARLQTAPKATQVVGGVEGDVEGDCEGVVEGVAEGASEGVAEGA